MCSRICTSATALQDYSDSLPLHHSSFKYNVALSISSGRSTLHIQRHTPLHTPLAAPRTPLNFPPPSSTLSMEIYIGCYERSVLVLPPLPFCGLRLALIAHVKCRQNHTPPPSLPPLSSGLSPALSLFEICTAPSPPPHCRRRRPTPLKAEAAVQPRVPQVTHSIDPQQ